MSIVIAIPARYNSKRFPGKPMAMIAGKTMLERVVRLAEFVAKGYSNVHVLVTTENPSIAQHAKELGVACALTEPHIRTGSDRALAACRKLKDMPEHIINLQGDAPFTQPKALTKMVEALLDKPDIDVVTPVHQLTWSDLDRLRAAKAETPFSGTTVIINDKEEAIWFSKNIIPAMREEAEMREKDTFSPVFQHIGLYGYKTEVLQQFSKMESGHYEQLEGLEQLRFLENGYKVQTVHIEIIPNRVMSGIDTFEDLKRAEALIEKFGDPMNEYTF